MYCREALQSASLRKDGEPFQPARQLKGSKRRQAVVHQQQLQGWLRPRPLFAPPVLAASAPDPSASTRGWQARLAQPETERRPFWVWPAALRACCVYHATTPKSCFEVFCTRRHVARSSALPPPHPTYCSAHPSQQHTRTRHTRVSAPVTACLPASAPGLTHAPLRAFFVVALTT